MKNQFLNPFGSKCKDLVRKCNFSLVRKACGWCVHRYSSLETGIRPWILRYQRNNISDLILVKILWFLPKVDSLPSGSRTCSGEEDFSPNTWNFPTWAPLFLEEKREKNIPLLIRKGLVFGNCERVPNPYFLGRSWGNVATFPSQKCTPQLLCGHEILFDQNVDTLELCKVLLWFHPRCQRPL